MKMKKQFNHTIDGGTWGGFKASYRLAEILNNLQDAYLRTSVGCIIHKYILRLKALDDLKYCSEYYVKFLNKDTEEMIKRRNFPKNIETHLLNVIHAFYLQKITKPLAI